MKTGQERRDGEGYIEKTMRSFMEFLRRERFSFSEGCAMQERLQRKG